MINSDRVKKGDHPYQYDLFVIGAGSGGVRASRISASHGAKVAIAEDMFLGGTCVNVGCVPKKLFVYGSQFAADVDDSKAFGWTEMTKGKPDWPLLIKNKNAEIERLNGVYNGILERAGVELFRGRASLKDAHTVVINDKEYTADKILIATGGWPMIPDIEGKEHVITSNEAFYLEKLPERIIIVGGGYIAVEFAAIFHGYGVHVTQLYRGPLFLRGFDHEVRAFLADHYKEMGIDLRFNSDISKIVKNDDGSLNVTLKDGATLESDLVMYATGRLPKTANLGLEEVGVKLGKKGEVIVNEFSQSNIPNIYCVGDATDRMNLTPVALAEGHCFADTEFGGKQRIVSYENVPTAVFSQPNLGTCGLTEEKAREKYPDDILIFKSTFRPLKHTLTKKNEKVFMKLIVQKSTDLVVGCHLLEHSAGDVIQLVGVAMKAKATKADFDATIGVHPTSAEELVTMRTPSSS